MSKLGSHHQRVTDAGLAWAKVAGLVKVLPDDARALDVADPRAIKIFRLNPNPPLEEHGASVVDRTLAMLSPARWGYPNLYIQILNEEDQRLGDGLERRVEQHREAVDRLAELGLDIGIAGYGFSVGQPERAEWDYLRFHGYGGVKAVILNQYFPKTGDTNFNDYLWTALRHRLVHEWTEGDHPPFIGGEGGVDAVYGSLPGWRINELSPEQFIIQLQTLDRYLQEDDYFLGEAIFISGAYWQWWNFEVDGLKLEQYFYIEEETMWDRHQAFSDWFKAGGAQGYNPDTAIGQFRAQHPELGVPLGGEIDYGDCVVQWFSGGIVYSEKNTWKTGMARTEEELPVSFPLP